jgi:NAD(P)-dependent dehydrogenase (short-subunit alcohol dehydrogenase family)
MTKTWFITGANRGFGLEIARAALQAGDRVVATARDPAQVTVALKDFGDRLLALPLDVTVDKAVEDAVKAAVARFERIDVLVNNAGYGQLGAFEEVSSQSIARQFETNVFGAFRVTRALLPTMRAQRSGYIITISSIGGLRGMDATSIYCATKFAVSGWSESLSDELGRFGIKATCVHPGRFRTDFLDSSSVRHGDIRIEDYHATSAAKRKAFEDNNHKQIGDPARFAQAILELAAMKDPPLRWAAGSDAFEILMQRAESLRGNALEYQALTKSTDFAAGSS